MTRQTRTYGCERASKRALKHKTDLVPPVPITIPLPESRPLSGTPFPVPAMAWMSFCTWVGIMPKAWATGGVKAPIKRKKIRSEGVKFSEEKEGLGRTPISMIWYLVGGYNLPLWKIMAWVTVGVMTFPTEWRIIKHVPNHQPDSHVSSFIIINH